MLKVGVINKRGGRHVLSVFSLRGYGLLSAFVKRCGNIAISSRVNLGCVRFPLEGSKRVLAPSKKSRSY
jgi:hypothetical protein